MEKNVFDNELIWNWVDSIKDNEERYDATEKLLPTDIQSLVDIGCGHGGFLNLVAARRKTIRLFGVDSSDGALQSVTTDKIKASITKIPIGNGEFDCVTALEVIEHLGPDEFTLALEELSRVAKKYIVISVPYMEDLDWNNTICPNCKKKFHIDGHMQVFGKRKMEDLFKTKNFKCVKKFRFGWSKKFWLHKQYVSIFLPSKKYQYSHYTVCPFCYTELLPPVAGPIGGNSENEILNLSPINKLRGIVKRIWPTVKKSYWIIALYERAK